MRHQSQTPVVERASLLQSFTSISFDVPYLEIVAIMVAVKTVTSLLALRPACGRGLPHFHCRRWLGISIGTKIFIFTRVYIPIGLKAPTAICTIAKPLSNNRAAAKAPEVISKALISIS